MRTVKHGTLEYEIAENIAVPHGFTNRLGGVSQGYLSSLNIGFHRGDVPANVVQNHAVLARELGFSAENLVLTHQVHGDLVRRVGKQDGLGPDHHLYPECDGLITNEPGTALMVFTADCTPVLLYDPVTGAVGAVHAGWRGTAADIAGKAVAAMVRDFGCEAKNIRAAIGPNIGFCCFQTDADVPAAMKEAYGPGVEAFIRRGEEKYYVDLKAINALALRRAGVEWIDSSRDCTRCRCDRYWSHRVTGAQRGSQGAIIVCKEGRR